MVHFSRRPVEHDRFPVVFAGLSPNLAEESGKAVVVVHRPAVEGMIVALGALGADAHEDLSHVLGGFQRIAFHLVKVRRRVGEGSPIGRQDVADHLIEWDILGDLLGKPGRIEVGRLVAHLVV